MEEQVDILKELREGKGKKKRMPKLKKEEKKTNWKAWMMMVILVLIGVAYGVEQYANWRAKHQWTFPLAYVGFYKEIEPVIAEVKQETLIASADVRPVKQSWTGKVSFYSSGEGCIGCHPEEIMANGEKFDENAMTLAFNKLPLNTKVRVTNLDNGANTVATVTDTGGFEQYGRIADLSKGLMTELNASTDVSNIKIEVL